MSAAGKEKLRSRVKHALLLRSEMRGGDIAGAGVTTGGDIAGGDIAGASLLEVPTQVEAIIELLKQLAPLAMKLVSIGLGDEPKRRTRKEAPPAEAPKRKRKAREPAGGALSVDMKRRNQLVKQVMKETGLSLPEASRYVKQHRLA